MYKDVLRTIAGIEVFPMLSLVVFVSVFALMLLWVTRLDRRRLDTLAHLPLRDATPVRTAAADRSVPTVPRGDRS